jgi:hypothetical protein
MMATRLDATGAPAGTAAAKDEDVAFTGAVVPAFTADFEAATSSSHSSSDSMMATRFD